MHFPLLFAYSVQSEQIDNGSVGHGHGSNWITNVNGSRGSRVSAVKHLTHLVEV